MLELPDALHQVTGFFGGEAKEEAAKGVFIAVEIGGVDAARTGQVEDGQKATGEALEDVGDGINFVVGEGSKLVEVLEVRGGRGVWREMSNMEEEVAEESVWSVGVFGSEEDFDALNLVELRPGQEGVAFWSGVMRSPGGCPTPGG